MEGSFCFFFQKEALFFFKNRMPGARNQKTFIRFDGAAS
jgi:hypothetical protein